jgi:hypothetical protein
MEQSPFGEADGISAAQKIPGLLWIAKVHYCVHRNSSLVPNSTRLIQSTCSRPVSLRYENMLTLRFRLRLGHRRSISSSGPFD